MDVVGDDTVEDDEDITDPTAYPSMLSRMALNDNKAGMKGLDKEKINRIIHESSVGSKFYENERKKDASVNERIKKLLDQMQKISPEQMDAAFGQTNAIIDELEKGRDLSRTIVHIDMDAFYASVEERDNPELKNKPMAVGGMDMLSTSNYVARRFGVRAAMPGFIAKKLCPELILVPLNFSKYTEVSREVREILQQYDSNFSTVGLDEAYLDLTSYLEKRKSLPETERTFSASIKSSNDAESKKSVTFGTSAEEVVREIRFKIEQKTELTASAGIAPNTMLAKVASDMNKPNGQFYLEPTRESAMAFVKDLSIRKVSGIGKVTEKLLNAIGVKTCNDLFEKRALLYSLFSSTMSNYFLRISIGIGSTMLSNEYERKSISTERTFQNISNPEVMYKKCEEICDTLEADAKKAGVKGLTVTLKIKLATFELHTRSRTLLHPVASKSEVYPVIGDLLRQELMLKKNSMSLRLIGVGLSKLTKEGDGGSKSQQKSLEYFLNKSSKKKQSDSTDIAELETENCNISKSNAPENEGQDSTINQRPEEDINDGELKTSNYDKIDSNMTDRSGIISKSEPPLTDSSMLNPALAAPSCNVLPLFDPSDLKASSSVSKDGKYYEGDMPQKDGKCYEEDKQANPETKTELNIEPVKHSSLSCSSTPNSMPETSPAQEHVSHAASTKTVCFGISKGDTSSDAAHTENDINENDMPSMTCPVCNATFCSLDVTLAKFNDHLDSCLNRKTIRDIVKSENEIHNSKIDVVSKKRKKTLKPKGPHKRKKKLSNGYGTLDSFLNK